VELRHRNTHNRFVQAQSTAHQGRLLGLPLPADVQQRFEHLAKQSIDKQRRIEAHDRLRFEEWRRAYLAPDRLKPGARSV
jgi:glutamate--cysteine ligase